MFCQKICWKWRKLNMYLKLLAVLSVIVLSIGASEIKFNEKDLFLNNVLQNKYVENAVKIVPPDADKIAEIFDMRMSEKEWKDGGKLGLSGSASGHAEAYYADIDCDGEKEFCVLIAGINTSNMYVYGYDKTGEWILKDRLHVTPQYMYFYDDADGERAFISVDSEKRHIFSLYSYKKGTTKNIETFSDKSCTQEIDYHADAIEKIIESLDGVSDIHDLPHASTDKYYEINVNDDKFALESFVGDIGKIFAE